MCFTKCFTKCFKCCLPFQYDEIDDFNDTVQYYKTSTNYGTFVKIHEESVYIKADKNLIYELQLYNINMSQIPEYLKEQINCIFNGSPIVIKWMDLCNYSCYEENKIRQVEIIIIQTSYMNNNLPQNISLNQYITDHLF